MRKVHSHFSAEPYKGRTITDKKVTVPNSALTLKEILKRFVRNEKVPVGKEGSYADYEGIDLEKMNHADLVDRAEFTNRLRQVSELYKLQEKERLIKAEIAKRTAPPATPGAGNPNPTPAAGGDGGKTLAE